MSYSSDSSTKLTSQRGVLAIIKLSVENLIKRLKNEAALDSYVAGLSLATSVEASTQKNTKTALERISSSEFFSPSSHSEAPFGYYCGRPIILDSSIIKGGIYISAAPNEAVVLDEKYGFLPQAIKDFRGRVSEVIGQNMLDDLRLLKFTMKYVQERLELNPQKVLEINQSLNCVADKKIALDIYLEARVGAARHLVLLTAYLLEALKGHGMAVGFASIDTSQSHERLLYTAQDGSIFIIDYCQNALEAGH